MDNNMLRRALWRFLRPLLQLITNLLSPEVGEEWLRELNKFLRKEPTWELTPQNCPNGHYYVTQVWVRNGPREYAAEQARQERHRRRRGVKLR
jgi:hypothetical protein